MSVGGATWQTATPITLEATSDPTPLAGRDVGTVRPYLSAWWKLTTTEPETDVLISADETTSTGGPGAYADTIMVVYREDQITAAGGDPDAAESLYYDNDGGINGRSKVAAILAPGTYYIRLGASDSSGAGVDSLVLSLPRWYWSAWVQEPVTTIEASQSFPGGTFSYTRCMYASATSTPEPEQGKLQEAVGTSYNTYEVITSTQAAGAAGLSLGPIGVTVSVFGTAAGLRDIWKYEAQGGYRRTTTTIRMPAPDDLLPPESEWPEGAFAAEFDPADSAEIFDQRVAYLFTEGSYDQSGTGGGGGALQDADGIWTYELKTGTDSVSIEGPLPFQATSSGELAVPTYPEPGAPGHYLADLETLLDLHEVRAADPSFGQGDGDGGGVYRVGACTWDLTGRTTYRPRRYRYRLLSPPAPAITTHAPPLRQHPRSDGLGFSSTRRVWPPSRSVQRSLRQGPGAYL